MAARWGLLTNHALVLMHVIEHPRSTLRDIADAVGVTERAALSLLPGVPMLPFLIMSSISGVTAWQIRSRKAIEATRAAEAAKAVPAAAEEPVSAALHLDDIRLELGYALLALVTPGEGPMLTDQIKGLRRQLANEMGFVMPAVRIQDNMQLPANTYVLRVKEIEAGRGELYPAKLLVMDPRGETIGLPGDDTTEPTFGLPATWIEAALKEAKARYEAYVYPGTRHGFHNNSTPRYQEAAAKLAWERTVAHFRRHLG